jgi:uncharacterized protein (TIRG00374 family)
MKKKIIPFIILLGQISGLKKIFEVSLVSVLLISFLKMVNVFFRGLKLKIATKLYGANLEFKEWFGLNYVVTLGNYLTPFKAGTSAMAVYLKKKYGFPYTFWVSLIGVLFLAQCFIFGLLGFFLVLFLPFLEEFRYGLLIFFIAIFLISMFILFFLPLPIKINIKIIRHIANSISEFKRARNFVFMLKMILLDISRVIALALSIYLAFKAFNFNASFYACIIIVIFLELLLIISLTPMSLGTREAIIILISRLIGADILTGTLVAALDRSLSIVGTLIFAPMFSYLIFKKKKN